VQLSGRPVSHRNEGSGVLLFFECVDEVLHDKRADDLQIVVQYFEESVGFAANAVKDDCPLLATTLPMRLTRGAGGISADRANFFERTMGLIETMLALDHQRVGKRQMAVEKIRWFGSNLRIKSTIRFCSSTSSIAKTKCSKSPNGYHRILRSSKAYDVLLAAMELAIFVVLDSPSGR